MVSDPASAHVIRACVDKSLGFLGQSSKDALLYHMREQYQFSLDDKEISLEKVKNAISGILGSESLLFDLIEKEIQDYYKAGEDGMAFQQKDSMIT